MFLIDSPLFTFLTTYHFAFSKNVNGVQVPLYYGRSWVVSQLDVATRHLYRVDSPEVRQAYTQRIEAVRTLASSMESTQFGHHHVICAVPNPNHPSARLGPAVPSAAPLAPGKMKDV